MSEWANRGRVCLVLLSFCAATGFACAQQNTNPSNTAPGGTFPRDPVTIPKDALMPLTFPYTLWSGIPVIQVPINGNNMERFAISTGLNANAVTPEAYTRLQLQASTRQYRINILDSMTTATEVHIQSMRLGNIPFTNVGAVLTDVFAMLSPRPHPDAPSGWLGVPFLSAFTVTFDFANQTIILNTPKSPLPTDPGTIQVPFTRKDGRIWVKVSIPRAKNFDAVVDTGTVTTLIPTEVAEKLKIAPQQVFPITKGNGREARAGLIILPKIGIGKVEAADVRTLFLAADAPPAFDKTLGVLGMDFLKRYKMTISFDKQKIAFTPYKPQQDENNAAENPPQ